MQTGKDEVGHADPGDPKKAKEDPKALSSPA